MYAHGDIRIWNAIQTSAIKKTIVFKYVDGIECSGIWKHMKTIKWNQQWIHYSLFFFLCLIGLRWLFFSLSCLLVFFTYFLFCVWSNPRFFHFILLFLGFMQGVLMVHTWHTRYVLTAAQRPRVCNVVSGFQLSCCMHTNILSRVCIAKCNKMQRLQRAQQQAFPFEWQRLPFVICLCLCWQPNDADISLTRLSRNDMPVTASCMHAKGKHLFAMLLANRGPNQTKGKFLLSFISCKMHSSVFHMSRKCWGV